MVSAILAKGIRPSLPSVQKAKLNIFTTPLSSDVGRRSDPFVPKGKTIEKGHAVRNFSLTFNIKSV